MAKPIDFLLENQKTILKEYEHNETGAYGIELSK